MTAPVTGGTADPVTAPGAGPVSDPGAAEAVAARPSNSDLEVVRIDPDAVAPGGVTTLHAFVANVGPDRTASSFRVVVTLPEGVTPEEPYFPEECQVLQNGHRVRCTFPAGLPAYESATALVPMRLAPTVELGELTGGWVSVRSNDDRNDTNNLQPFTISVVENVDS
ncbi:hypothetical protein [Kitasatospora sp. NPDC093806]|uniref:hypothetical protein n=1 Tax=Kitasatospora sp. NPDC093806 TaxID=3155075 RepID=UPI0034182F07